MWWQIGDMMILIVLVLFLGKPSGKQASNAIYPRAGGEGNHFVLSIFNGVYSIGEGFIGFLAIKESNALRSVCVEFLDAVMDFPWMDAKSIIKGSLRA